MEEKEKPKAFISYAYDSDQYKEWPWVLQLATQLRADGVDVILDKWHLRAAFDKHYFMEQSVLKSDYVVMICTSKYAEKANMRSGGVGNEAMIITAKLANEVTNPKYIPVLCDGTWNSSIPIWAERLLGIDLTDYPNSMTGYENLLLHLHDALPKAPPLGSPPDFSSFNNEKDKSIKTKDKSTESIQTPFVSIEKIFKVEDRNVQFWKDQLSLYPMSYLISSFCVKRHGVDVNILTRYELKCSAAENIEFDNLNTERIKKKLHRQYAYQRFRLLGAPKIKSGKVIIEVAPFNFTTFAILRDSKNIKLKNEILGKLEKMTKPQHLIDDVEPRSLVPVGIEILIVTKDNKVLFRQRGTSVQTETKKWDVSISGYLGENDLDVAAPNKIDLSLTAHEELKEEIQSHGSPLNANPSNIEFLGLHLNRETGATDILGCWHINNTSKELKSMLTKKSGNVNAIFKTTEVSAEPFVSDTNNYLVDFTMPTLMEAITGIHSKGERFMAEAFLCLLLSAEKFCK